SQRKLLAGGVVKGRFGNVAKVRNMVSSFLRIVSCPPRKETIARGGSAGPADRDCGKCQLSQWHHGPSRRSGGAPTGSPDGPNKQCPPQLRPFSLMARRGRRSYDWAGSRLGRGGNPACRGTTGAFEALPAPA